MTDEGMHGAAIRAAGIELHCLGMRRGLPSPRALYKLVALMRATKPDLVMTWLYHADLLGTLAASIARQGRIVWNLRCSSLDLDKHPWTTGLTVRLLGRMSGLPWAVAANSIAGRRAHEALGYRPRRWIDLPNGFETDLWRPDDADRASVRAELGLAVEDVAIGLVSRVDPEKDHATFLQSLAALTRRYPSIRGVLVGRGTDGLEIPPDVTSRVAVLGERKDVPRLLLGLVFFVWCSLSEGFPNAIGEAMATGVPCVVTDAGDSARIIGDTGLVVPSRDVGAMTRALEKFIAAGADSRRATGARARARILENWPMDRVARLYCEAWRELIAG
jgi:glycosyltransferase involved in cell wall biosynthesis